jgi:hypothetical protein
MRIPEFGSHQGCNYLRQGCGEDPGHQNECAQDRRALTEMNAHLPDQAALAQVERSDPVGGPIAQKTQNALTDDVCADVP